MRSTASNWSELAEASIAFETSCGAPIVVEKL